MTIKEANKVIEKRIELNEKLLNDEIDYEEYEKWDKKLPSIKKLVNTITRLTELELRNNPPDAVKTRKV